MDLVAGCFQFEVRSGDVETNTARVKQALRSMKDRGCRLAVLPEMWSCGFHYAALRDMALRSPSILEALTAWAREMNLVIVGSLPELDNGVIFNVVHVVDADGRLKGRYRKIHLFTHGREHLHFARGRETLVTDTAAGKLGHMICYDLRFPELARRLALDGAQILCVPALWPQVRIDHWSLLLRARAVENQLFVLGCNGAAGGNGASYGGRSTIVSPLGRVLAEGGGGEECLVATLRLGELEAFRSRIPCFEDRLPGIYNIC